MDEPSREQLRLLTSLGRDPLLFILNARTDIVPIAERCEQHSHDGNHSPKRSDPFGDGPLLDPPALRMQHDRLDNNDDAQHQSDQRKHQRPYAPAVHISPFRGFPSAYSRPLRQVVQ
jgi:hypothetical protein